MKKQTIQSMINELQDVIDHNDHTQARQIADALSDRKLNKNQKAQLEALAEQIDDGEGYRMSDQLAKYRERYQRSVAASGSKSLNNGDDLANYLEMKTAKEVCELADEFTPIDGQTHWERYERLNEGQRRMNSGNKLRAAIKKGAITVTDNGLERV